MRFAAGISFSIPIDTAKDFLSQAIERVKSSKYASSSSKTSRRTLGPNQRWYIGVSMLTLTPQILEELRRRDQSFNKVESGVFVPQVNYGSPAHKWVLVEVWFVNAVSNGWDLTCERKVSKRLFQKHHHTKIHKQVSHGQHPLPSCKVNQLYQML